MARDAGDYVLDAPDRYVNDEHAWKREYKNDPRPNAGITCNGRYLPDDWRHRPCRVQYHCVPCGLRKSICVDHADKAQTIGFACPACRAHREHCPVGVPLYLARFNATAGTGGVGADE